MFPILAPLTETDGRQRIDDQGRAALLSPVTCRQAVYLVRLTTNELWVVTEQERRGVTFRDLPILYSSQTPS